MTDTSAVTKPVNAPLEEYIAPSFGDAIAPDGIWDAAPLTTTPGKGGMPFGGMPPGVCMGGLPGAFELDRAHSVVACCHRRQSNGETAWRGCAAALRIRRGDFDVATHLFNDLQNRFWVLPNDPTFTTGPNAIPIRPNTTNYSLYPRLSRVGLEYYGLPVARLCDAVPSGRVEVDFQTINPGGTESRELLRLRLAYAQVKGEEWTLLAGQDWDIVSPLIPSINDNGAQWNVGNTGDRRPIVKLLRDHELCNGWIWQFQNGFGMADAINSIDRDGDGYRDNEYWGLPSYQGRLGLIGDSWVKDRKFIAGMWTMAGNQETNAPFLGNREFPMWGYGFDMQLPLTKRFMFRGEAFQGSNIDDFRGGIGQGVNNVTGETVETAGGWAEVLFQLNDVLIFSTGYSIDDPQNSDIPVGGRTLNHNWYIGGRYVAGSGLMFGMDFQDWTTEWNGFDAGNAQVVKTFMQLNF